MSDVTLAIGGREFKVACANGEEAHILGLGRMIDGKLAAMGGAAGQSEARMLLFATLLLADEIHDLRAVPKAPPPPPASELAIAGLETVATRLENIAAHLEGTAHKP